MLLVCITNIIIIKSIIAIKALSRSVLILFGAAAMVVYAEMPQQGTVVNGQATIEVVNGQHTRIQQGSNKAIIHWDSFNISQPGHVEFQQPSNDVESGSGNG